MTGGDRLYAVYYQHARTMVNGNNITLESRSPGQMRQTSRSTVENYTLISGGGGGGGGGATTFLALTDTPSAFTADQFVAVNSAGTALEFVDAPSGGGTTLTANSVLAAMLALQDSARRQTFWARGVYQELNPNVSIQDFNITCGTTGTGTGTIDGFSSTIGSGTSIAPTTFRPSGATRSYEIVAVTQRPEISGAPFAVTVSPDPGNELPADYAFGIRPPSFVNEIQFLVASATKTITAGDAVYTWSDNSDFEMNSGNARLRVLQPLAEIHATIPTNFSALSGTVAPEQFRDNSIAPSRAIGGTLAQQSSMADEVRILSVDVRYRATSLLQRDSDNSTDSRPR